MGNLYRWALKMNISINLFYILIIWAFFERRRITCLAPIDMKGFFYNDFANAERGPGVVVGGFASFAKGRKFGEAGTS